MHLTVDELRHRTVLDASGRAIGDVGEVLFDAATWQVRLLRVVLKKEAASMAGVHASIFKKPFVDVPTSLVQSVADVVLLSVPVESLHNDAMPAPSSQPAP